MSEMSDHHGDGPADWLARVEAEQQRTRTAIEPDVRLIYGVWGAAWLLGFLVLWYAAADGAVDVSMPLAGVVFALCLAAAMGVTAVHVARRGAGVRGVSSRTGAMYGWSWLLGFVALAAVMAGAHRSGLPGDTASLLWAVLSGLVVGTLYLAGGALWQDRVQFGLGLWILAANALGAQAGYPGVYLVMSLAGGGGFLTAAGFFLLRGKRAR